MPKTIPEEKIKITVYIGPSRVSPAARANWARFWKQLISACRREMETEIEGKDER